MSVVLEVLVIQEMARGPRVSKVLIVVLDI